MHYQQCNSPRTYLFEYEKFKCVWESSQAQTLTPGPFLSWVASGDIWLRMCGNKFAHLERTWQSYLHIWSACFSHWMFRWSDLSSAGFAAHTQCGRPQPPTRKCRLACWRELPSQKCAAGFLEVHQSELRIYIIQNSNKLDGTEEDLIWDNGQPSSENNGTGEECRRLHVLAKALDALISWLSSSTCEQIY